MKRNVIGIIAAGLLVSGVCYADFPEQDLRILGYSDTVVECIGSDFGLINHNEADLNAENADISEVDSTVEQLKELGVSRSITSANVDRSAEVKAKNEVFWNEINSRLQKIEGVVVSEETKQYIKNSIAKTLTANGYKIVQLEIIPLAEGSTKNAVRALVRVVKPMKTGSYKEIQASLAIIKDLCLKAATVDGNCMLSEMTTFIAENPKNNYYYEKTILK